MSKKTDLQNDPFVEPEIGSPHPRKEHIVAALENQPGTFSERAGLPTDQPGIESLTGRPPDAYLSAPQRTEGGFYRQEGSDVVFTSDKGVKTTVVPNGELVPYQRIADISDDLSLHPLEEYQDIDLLVWKYNKWAGTESMGPFMTLEVSLASDPSEGRFLVNCGGVDAMRKIESAFSKLDPPMLASFHKKRLTNGNTFWILS